MFEIDKKNFGIFVAEHRKEKGLTQKELAEKLFISDKAVSKWETGASIPDAALWVPLAEILGVTVTELLMCKKLEEQELSSGEVESLVKKAISFSEEDPEQKKREKKQRIAVFAGGAVIFLLETFFLYKAGMFDDVSLITVSALSLIFGAYFMIFVKEKLPTYYDENKISAYSDGFLRMNMPGISFNNSNWPHIVTCCRVWAMLTLVCYPLLLGIMRLFPVLGKFELFFTLALVLGGLFIPIYIVGKKYQ